MTAPVEQVARMLAATRIEDAEAFTWFGRRFAIRPGAELGRTLAQHLYINFYCAGGPAPLMGYSHPVPAGPASDLVRRLAAANEGEGGWQPGWRMVGESHDGEVVVERDGLRLRAPACDVRGDGPGGEAEVRRTTELFGASPGFYTALGDAYDRPDVALARVYVNVTSAAAPGLVAALTRRLNLARTPFRLKVLADPRAYGRCDAAILYVGEHDASSALEQTLVATTALRPPVASRVPALTRPVAPGVAFAEDPGDGRSFGESRCRLLAEAVLEASAEGVTSAAARLGVVARRFAECGIDLERPHLRAGSRLAVGALA